MIDHAQWIVERYVKLRHSDKLHDLRFHRLNLLKEFYDNHNLDVGGGRRDCERDLAIIEAGLNSLCRTGPAEIEQAIITFHNTSVGYSQEDNYCYHIHKRDDLRPVVVDRLGSRASLYFKSDGRKVFLTTEPSGRLVACALKEDDLDRFQFETVNNSLEKFSLSRSGFYLSAQNTGELLCNRLQIKDWEIFYSCPPR